MKKVFLGIATLAALASCSKNEVVDIPTSRAIGFSTLNNKVISRSANDSTSNYMVYAKSTTAGEAAWFIAEELKSGATTDATVSNALYYWPASPATVSFWAYAPKTSKGTLTVVPNYALGKLPITYTVPATAVEDFTIAAPLTAKSSGSVAFTFAHVLSKLTVSAAMTKTMADAGYSISFTSATIGGVKKNSGTIDATDATQTWTDGSNLSTPAVYKSSKVYMIYPQTSTGIIVQLKGVTIKKGASSVYTGDLAAYTIKAGDVAAVATGTPSPINTFGKGKHYALNFTINNLSTDGSGGDTDGDLIPNNPGNPLFGAEIVFTSSVASWDTAAGNSTGLTQP